MRVTWKQLWVTAWVVSRVIVWVCSPHVGLQEFTEQTFEVNKPHAADEESMMLDTLDGDCHNLLCQRWIFRHYAFFICQGEFLHMITIYHVRLITEVNATFVLLRMKKNTNLCLFIGILICRVNSKCINFPTPRKFAAINAWALSICHFNDIMLCLLETAVHTCRLILIG